MPAPERSRRHSHASVPQNHTTMALVFTTVKTQIGQHGSAARNPASTSPLERMSRDSSSTPLEVQATPKQSS